MGGGGEENEREKNWGGREGEKGRGLLVNGKNLEGKSAGLCCEQVQRV